MIKNHLKKYTLAVLFFFLGVFFATSIGSVFATEEIPTSPPPQGKVTPNFDELTIKDNSNLKQDILIKNGQIFFNPRYNSSKNAISIFNEINANNEDDSIKKGMLELRMNKLGRKQDNDEKEYPTFIDLSTYNRADGNKSSQTMISASNGHILHGGTNISNSNDIGIHVGINKYLIKKSGFTSNILDKFYGITSNINGKWDNFSIESDPAKQTIFPVYAKADLSFVGFNEEIQTFTDGIGLSASGNDYGVLGSVAKEGAIGVAGLIGYNNGNPIKYGGGVLGAIVSSSKEYLKTAYLGAIKYNETSNNSAIYGIYTDDDAYINILRTNDIQSPASKDLTIAGLNNLNLKANNNIIFSPNNNLILGGSITKIASTNGLQIGNGDLNLVNGRNVSMKSLLMDLQISNKYILDATNGDLLIKSLNNGSMIDLTNGTIYVKDLYVKKIHCIDGGISCLPTLQDILENPKRPKLRGKIIERLKALKQIIQSTDPVIVRGTRRTFTPNQVVSLPALNGRVGTRFEKPKDIGPIKYTDFQLKDKFGDYTPCIGKGDREWGHSIDGQQTKLERRGTLECIAANFGNFNFRANAISERIGGRGIFGAVKEIKKDGAFIPIKDIDINCGNGLTVAKSNDKGEFKVEIPDNFDPTINLNCVAIDKTEKYDNVPVNLGPIYKDGVFHVDFYVNPKEEYYNDSLSKPLSTDDTRQYNEDMLKVNQQIYF